MQGKKLILLAVLFIGILVGVGVLVLSVPLYSCANEVLSETSSREAKATAAVFTNDCGATTSVVTAVSLRPIEAVFRPEESDIIFSYNGSTTVSVRWVGPKRLEVKFVSKGQEPYKLTKSWRTIDVIVVAI